MAYNPFPGDGDFKYLALEKKELMEQQNVPFDGKKNTWIPDPKEGFLKAEIESTKGEEVTVVTDKGEVRDFKMETTRSKAYCLTSKYCFIVM